MTRASGPRTDSSSSHGTAPTARPCGPRLGAPHRYAYGATPVEGLDVYRTTRPNAPINIFIHGGAWRSGLAKNYAFPAEIFVHAGAHCVVPDFAWVQDVGGILVAMRGAAGRSNLAFSFNVWR